MWAGALGPGFEITGSLLSQPPHAAPEPGDAQIHHKTSNASGEQEGLEDDMGQGLALGTPGPHPGGTLPFLCSLLFASATGGTHKPSSGLGS